MTAWQQTPNSDEIVNEIHIDAPAERVFQALVDPLQAVQWWGQTGIYRCTEFESDLRVGGTWRTIGLDGDGHHFEVIGEYLELDPPRLLSSSWVATGTGDAKTKVRWERNHLETELSSGFVTAALQAIRNLLKRTGGGQGCSCGCKLFWRKVKQLNNESWRRGASRRRFATARRRSKRSLLRPNIALTAVEQILATRRIAHRNWAFGPEHKLLIPNIRLRNWEFAKSLFFANSTNASDQGSPNWRRECGALLVHSWCTMHCKSRLSTLMRAC